MLKTITLVAVANLVAVTLGLSVAQAGNYNQSHGYRFERCYHKHHGYNEVLLSPLRLRLLQAPFPEVVLSSSTRARVRSPAR